MNVDVRLAVEIGFVIMAWVAAFYSVKAIKVELRADIAALQKELDAFKALSGIADNLASVAANIELVKRRQMLGLQMTSDIAKKLELDQRDGDLVRDGLREGISL